MASEGAFASGFPVIGPTGRDSSGIWEEGEMEESEKGVLIPRFSLDVRLKWFFIEIHSNTWSPCYAKVEHFL